MFPIAEKIERGMQGLPLSVSCATFSVDMSEPENEGFCIMVASHATGLGVIMLILSREHYEKVLELGGDAIDGPYQFGMQHQGVPPMDVSVFILDGERLRGHEQWMSLTVDPDEEITQFDFIDMPYDRKFSMAFDEWYRAVMVKLV